MLDSAHSDNSRYCCAITEPRASFSLSQITCYSFLVSSDLEVMAISAPPSCTYIACLLLCAYLLLSAEADDDGDANEGDVRTETNRVSLAPVHTFTPHSGLKRTRPVI